MPGPVSARIRTILIALLLTTSWGCGPGEDTDSDEPPEPPPVLDEDVTLPAEASVEVGAATASVAAVQNERSEALWVVFPRGTVEEPAQVTLRIKDLEVAGLPDEAIVAGFEIEGVDHRLARKARLFFDAAPKTQLPPNTGVFFIKANGRLELLPNQEVTDTTLGADLYHFSELVVAAPEAAQFSTAVEPPSTPGAAPPASIDALVEQAEVSVEYAELANQLGLDDAASDALESAKESLESRIDDLLEEEPPEDPCDESLAEELRLSVAAQQLGADDDLVSSLHSRLSERGGECLRDGSLTFAARAFVIGYTLSMDCPDSIRFTHLDDGRLVGGGRQTCLMDERLEFVDPEGSLTLDLNVAGNVSLEGEYHGFTLQFEPPSTSPVDGYIRVTAETSEGTFVVADIEITETTGWVEFGYPGFMWVNLAAPIGTEAAPYSPSFALNDGATFQHIERSERAVAVFTWTLHLDPD